MGTNCIQIVEGSLSLTGRSPPSPGGGPSCSQGVLGHRQPALPGAPGAVRVAPGWASCLRRPGRPRGGADGLGSPSGLWTRADAFRLPAGRRALRPGSRPCLREGGHESRWGWALQRAALPIREADCVFPLVSARRGVLPEVHSLCCRGEYRPGSFALSPAILLPAALLQGGRAPPTWSACRRSSCDGPEPSSVGADGLPSRPPALKPSLPGREWGVSPGWEWTRKQAARLEARGQGLPAPSWAAGVSVRLSSSEATQGRPSSGQAPPGVWGRGLPCPLGVSGQACLAGAWPVSWKVLLCPAAKEPGLSP